MLKIIPIRDLKDTSNISNMVKEEAGPVYVTKNGYEDMVILSATEYKKFTDELDKAVAENKMLSAKCDFAIKIMEAEKDFADGKTFSDEEVMEEIRQKYGFED